MNEPFLPTGNREERLERVLADYLHAVEAGRPVDRQQWLAKHPDLADELRSFFANHDAMDRLAAPLGHDAKTLPPDSHAASSQDGRKDPLVESDRIRYVGDYQLLQEIARGGMGVVYKARQVSLNRIVAVKMILAGQLATPDDVQRFRQEAEAAANLDHPAIVPIYEVGQHEGQHYFSMKLIEGSSLANLLAAHTGQFSDPRRPDPAMSQRASAELISRVARAVHHSHQRGILHRDLKPGNILLDADGLPHVTDFGLAKRVEGASDVTRTGAIIGTPSYMAPEQAQGARQLTTAADIYSLGAILYELLTGRPPFRGTSPLDTLLSVVADEPTPPRAHHPQIDRDLEAVVLKCLEKNPEHRYDSAAALADELDRWLRGETVLARTPTTWQRLTRWARRKPAVASLIATTVLATIGALAGVSIATWQAIVARNEATRRAEAEHQARIDQATSLYVSQIGRAYAEWQAGRSEQALAILNECDPEQRNWEWHYVRRQCMPDVDVLELRSGRARQIVYSPSGRYLAAIGEFQDLHVWDLVEPGYRVTPRNHTLPIAAVAFAADDARIASLDSQRIIIWETATMRTLASFEHPNRTRHLSFSPDGQFLLVGTTVLAAADGQSICTLPLADQHLACWWSPDGARVWSLAKNALTAYDPATGEVTSESMRAIEPDLGPWVALTSHRDRILGLQSRTDVQSYGRWLTLFDAAKFEPLTYLAAWPPNRRVDALSLSADGSRAVAAYSDSAAAPQRFQPSATLWDTARSRTQATLSTNRVDDLGNPQLNPAGTCLAWSAGTSVMSWRIPSRRDAERVAIHPRQVLNVGFSQHAQTLVSLGAIDGLRTWDRATHRELPRSAEGLMTISGNPQRTSLTVDPSGQWAAWANDFSVQLVPLASGAKPQMLPQATSLSEGFVRPVFSPDGKWLAIADAQRVLVWDVTQAKLVRWGAIPSQHGPLSGISALAFSADGQRLAVSAAPERRA